MEQLQIFRQGERVLSFTLDKNLIRIGRSSPCEIELPDPSLSREHCLLVKKERSWFLEDSSKNGVRTPNGDRLTERALVNLNQRYRIGKFFSFELNEAGVPSKDKTLVISNAPTQIVGVNTQAQTITLGRASVFGKLPDGRSVRKKVLGSGLSMGCHPENDLVLIAPDISQFHARVDLIDNVYVFSDLGSTNGSALNRTPIYRAPLFNGSKIKVGPFQFDFELQTEEIAIQPKNSNRFYEMVSKNKTMKTVFTTIEVVAPSEAAVFIHGETGTGKELVAKALHQLSRREEQPFVAINCAALPKDLVESELFGHEKGAFTGATSMRLGAFEAAHQGTLFLDEIAELDLNVQAKLLRALETKEIRRLGSNSNLPVSLRLVSASHKDLLDEVRKGRFREDLFYRLHIVQIELPPLKDRLEDLEILAEELFLQLKLPFAIDDKAMDFLKTYSYPGNIREFKNILQRAVIEFEVRSVTKDKQFEKILSLQDFRFLRATSAESLSKKQLAERDRILSALREYSFVQIRAAKSLDMPVSTMNDKIRRYGITIG